MARYWSKEWVEEWQRKLNTDEEYLKKAATLNIKCWWVITDYPGNTDVKVLAEFREGKMVDFTYEEKPAPSDFRTEPWDPSISVFRGIAGYEETWIKMHKGELNPLKALMAKVFKMDADLPRLIPEMPALNAMNDNMSTVSCEY